MRRLAAGLCSLLLLAAISRQDIPAQDIPAPPAYHAIKKSINDSLSIGTAPSLAIAVLERGELVWAEGFGMADRERQLKATADTIYRLASISKPFTATALMKLVDSGDLNLDQPVNNYLDKPGVIAHRGSSDAITLRRLANHTAGLPTHWNFFYGDAKPPSRAESIRRYGFAAWRPGSRTNYSNLAFGILDHVIARTSGRTYRDYLVMEVLDPLGMSHSDVGIRPKCEQQAAVAYGRERGEFVPIENYGFDHDGASAVCSSARDLMQFARLQIQDGEVDGKRVLSRTAIHDMRQRKARGIGNSFGVAWSVSRTKGAMTLAHTGGMPGVSTSLKVFPKQGSAVAVLCNFGSRHLVNGAMRKAVAVVLREVVKEKQTKLRTPGPSTPAPRDLSSAVGRFEGEVAHPDGAIATSIVVRTLSDVQLKLGKTTVSNFRVLEVDANHIKLQFSIPFGTAPKGQVDPTLILELDRRPKSDPDGWHGLLYVREPNTSQLPHWVSLQHCKD